MKLLHILLCYLILSPSAFSGHLVGGDITWTCNGSGQYIFKLRVFRDCSGPNMSTANQQITVWNHPSITAIPLIFISQSDISPACTQVGGGPAAISCGNPGTGAIEEYIFISAPTIISGVPPAQGWAFTWSNFSRNVNIDNLQNPATYGLTLRAMMYPFNGNNTNPCYDSSPQLNQTPLTVYCAGQNFYFNPAAYEPDADSMSFSFERPLNQIDPLNPQFNPPVSPIYLPFVTGYSYTSPTPNTSMHPNNVPANINQQTGELTFTSYTLGDFVIVIKVESWRCGQKISEVFSEIQIAIANCAPNNAPAIAAPFINNALHINVPVGQVVNINIAANDSDLLQNGSPQSIILEASGSMFGAGYTNASTGCDKPPCATLGGGSPQTSISNLNTVFNWQTDCSHLPNGCNQSSTYNFVFKIQDDFCPVPAVSLVTLSVTILPPSVVQKTEILCADVLPNGDVTLNWIPPLDPDNSFVQYDIYNGTNLITSIPILSTSSYTHIGADAQNGSQPYQIVVRSGCNGVNAMSSDTVNTIFLNVNNPGNGTAILQWNPLVNPNHSSSAGVYNIYREYPIGNYTLIGSVPYGTNYFVDTITICSDSIAYKIAIADNNGCVSNSSVDGAFFNDVLPPYEPIISYVTVDTATGLANIVWNINPMGDTEGYIILNNINGNWVIIDTVWGINNTSFTYALSNANSQSEFYGIAAFDTCWHGNPLSPNTSAMGTPHQTIYVTTQLNVCAREVTLSWNAYQNWSNGVAYYEIYSRENNGPYNLLSTTTNTAYTHSGVNRLSTYRYLIKAVANQTGYTSLSNIAGRYIHEPEQPQFAYLKTASVLNNSEVVVRYYADLNAINNHYVLERSKNFTGPYSTVSTVYAVSNPVQFIDDNVNPSANSYYYRVQVVDSCGDYAMVSNVGKTILLNIVSDNLNLTNTLTWNHYENWDGIIQQYNIYRSINGTFNSTPIASVPGNQSFYTDTDIENLLQTTGEFCYYIEAVENFNTYGQNETSISNIHCVAMEPLLYVPNAFIIGGINNTFKPVGSFIDFNNYEFTIFNRMSEIVFNTRDINAAWDGKYRGEYCKEGIYIWQIQFTDGNGKDYLKRGFVTLLKSN
jgi:hypothetical protein